MSEKIIVFDTTLRDGEQSPGCSMNFEEKLRMARQIESLGVDVIEAGFPIASEGDFQAVLPADPIWAVPLWLATHVDLHRTEKVQAMLNAIKASPRTLTEQAAPGCGGLFS